MIQTEPSKLQSALFKHEFGSWLKLNKRYAQFVLIKNMSMSETVYPIIKSSDHSLLLWHLGKSYKVSQNCQMQHLIDDFLKSNKMIYGICSVTAHNCKMLLQSSAQHLQTTDTQPCWEFNRALNHSDSWSNSLCRAVRCICCLNSGTHRCERRSEQLLIAESSSSFPWAVIPSQFRFFFSQGLNLN